MIGILEDTSSIRELVLYALKNSGYEAVGYANSKELWENISIDKPDLLLLDIMLPEEDGLSVIKKLRKQENTKNLPVIMLTAKDSEFDKVIGLDAGADDYITKPFSMLELVSRIKALLRRTGTAKAKTLLQFKELSLNDESHKVMVGNKAIEMTLKEYNTLKFLLGKNGKVATREELLNSVWGYDFTGETRTVDVHIRTIRSKLGECENYIETIRGVGYRIGESND